MLTKIINIVLIVMLSWCIITLYLVEGLIFNKNELPLSDINSIVVDNEQNVYIGIDGFEKVQIYDKNGNFVSNWDINAYGGSVCLELSVDTNIIVYAKRTDIKSVYNTNGNLITSENIRKIPYEIVMNQYCFKDGNNDVYEITDDFFPKITKNGIDFISQKFYYKAFYEPQNLFIALFCIILLAFNNVKIVIRFFKKYLPRG
jgi:hypothetical protein